MKSRAGVLRAAYEGGQRILDVHQLIALDVDQFHGIEIEEFPAQIAQVALWLVDHQMNLRVGEEVGQYFARIPLKATPHIVNGNALRLDWAQVLPAQRCAYVLGNPPFVGAKFMDDAQRADAQAVFAGVEGGGLLDFVAAWYAKAVRYAKGGEGHAPRCAFVSTNSITQGEQVGVLWGWMLAQGAKTIYEYEDIRGEPHAVAAGNINPYLVDAPDVVLPRRSRPICDVPEISFGSMANDGGHLLLSPDERDAVVQADPDAERWLRPFLGADEFINGLSRWCLWLKDCPPATLRAMPSVLHRVAAVRSYRQASKRETTRRLAETPTLFGEDRQPGGRYVLVPRHSSERRAYVPMGFVEAGTVCGDANMLVAGAGRYHFGILTSTMHNAWVRYTCGRLKSDFRYSAAIVYNNFPWPESPSDPQRAAVEAAAQGVLDARAQFPGATLADLYDPLTMPPALLKAQIDRGVIVAVL